MNKTVFATGKANDATILQNAVYKNALAGGGHLNALRRFVLFRQLELKSNVCLCLEPKQVLSNKPKPFEPGG